MMAVRLLLLSLMVLALGGDFLGASALPSNDVASSTQTDAKSSVTLSEQELDQKFQFLLENRKLKHRQIRGSKIAKGMKASSKRSMMRHAMRHAMRMMMMRKHAMKKMMRKHPMKMMKKHTMMNMNVTKPFSNATLMIKGQTNMTMPTKRHHHMRQRMMRRVAKGPKGIKGNPGMKM
jgi:hypothetical protein